MTQKLTKFVCIAPIFFSPSRRRSVSLNAQPKTVETTSSIYPEALTNKWMRSKGCYRDSVSDRSGLKQADSALWGNI